MKVWLFYLSLPEYMPDYDRDDIDIFSSMSQKILKTLVYNKDTGRYTGLYAYTNDKALAEMFEDMHDMNLFVKIKDNMSRSAYDELKNACAGSDGYKDYESLELEWVDDFMESGYTEKISFPLTGMESTLIDDEGCNAVEEDLMTFSYVNYECLKPKYIKALDTLIYCLMHKVNHGDDEEIEYVNDTWSYGVSPEGMISGGSYYINRFNLYRKLYRLILRKEWKYNEGLQIL